jgi:hypothetical protein
MENDGSSINQVDVQIQSLKFLCNLYECMQAIFMPRLPALHRVSLECAPMVLLHLQLSPHGEQLYADLDIRIWGKLLRTSHTVADVRTVMYAAAGAHSHIPF